MKKTTLIFLSFFYLFCFSFHNGIEAAITLNPGEDITNPLPLPTKREAGAEGNTAMEQPKSLEFWYVQSRKYEDGRDVNIVAFALKDAQDNYVMSNIVKSATLYDPNGNEVILSDLEFWAGESLGGSYDAESEEWQYNEDFEDESGYYSAFQETLKIGDYHLVVIDENNVIYDEYWEFDQKADLPIISSNSFDVRKDASGNFIWSWDVPVISDLDTSVRAWIDIYNDETPIGDLIAKIPTNMGQLFVPNTVFQKIESKGNKFFIGLHIRTNDNNNRSYSNEIEIDLDTLSTTKEMILKAGWNLISLPVTPEDSAWSALFPDAEVAYEFQDGRYVYANSLEPEKGYWIKVPSDKTYTITGQNFNNYTLPLSPGWHLLGAVNAEASPSTTPDEAIEVIYKYIDGAYNETKNLSPGYGYWVKIKEQCEFSLGD
ncbi:exported hypothetical protein [Candidatus Magnetomoraceae bacterium gMMP-13]